MSWLHTNYASLRQCNSLFNSLCFKGDSPSSETLQAVLGAAGGCSQHLEEPAQAIFLRSSHTKLSCAKSHLCCPHQSSAAPSELHSGPAAPKTLGLEVYPCSSHLHEDSVKKFIIQAKAEIICSNFSFCGQTFSCPCFAMGKTSSLQKQTNYRSSLMEKLLFSLILFFY